MIISVDTGGTKTLIVAFSEDGAILRSQKFPTPSDEEVYLTTITAAIRELAGFETIRAMTIALPGVIRNQQALICKNLGWRNFDVLSALQRAFPGLPMWLENDANLGGVGAAHLLPHLPKRLLYVTISTGIGGGYIVDGHIEPSLSEIEIGDITFEYDGHLTSWESIANGKAIRDRYGVYASELQDPAAIRDIAIRISRGFLTLLPALRPDVVAVGGGIGAHYSRFAPSVAQELAILGGQYQCPIATALHPEEVVAYGGYFYAKDQLAL